MQLNVAKNQRPGGSMAHETEIARPLLADALLLFGA
jgi:hypothetical protein